MDSWRILVVKLVRVAVLDVVLRKPAARIGDPGSGIPDPEKSWDRQHPPNGRLSISEKAQS